MRHSLLRLRLGLAVTLLGSLLACGSATAQAPRLLVRVEHAPLARGEPARGPGSLQPEFTTRFEVSRDGRATREGVPTRLTARQLARVRALVGRTRLRMERRPVPVCTGLPNHVVRVTTPRGRLSFQAPCMQPPDATVLALLEGLEELVRVASPSPPTVEPEPPSAPTPEPAPPNVEPAPAVPLAGAPTILVRYAEQRMRLTSGMQGITVYGDGRVVTLEGTVTLDVEALRRLREELHRVSFERDESRPPVCAAAHEGTASFEIPGRGSASWSLPCGRATSSVASMVGTLRRLGRVGDGRPQLGPGGF